MIILIISISIIGKTELKFHAAVFMYRDYALFDQQSDDVMYFVLDVFSAYFRPESYELDT
jgi:hypothetical protein